MPKIQEIEALFNERAVELLNDWHAAVDSPVSANSVSDQGGVLSGSQRRQIAAQNKQESLAAKSAELKELYTDNLVTLIEAVEKRTRTLSKDLFKVESVEAGAAAFSASDEGLRRMLGYAVKTGSPEMAKAAFAEAESRGLSSVVSAYFEQVNPEARELYEEWSEAPDPQDLARKMEDAEKLFSVEQPVSAG